MKLKKSQPVVGRIAQVDVCPRDAGFVLSVGPVSVWLQLEAAQDVVATLARALLLDARVTRASDPLRGKVEPETVKSTPATAAAEIRALGTSN